MNKLIEQTKDFHKIFNHPIGTIDTLEPLNIRQLRIKLLFEELCELAEASDCKRTLYELCSAEKNILEQKNFAINAYYLIDSNNVNQIEELDALCDIQYVLNGKIITAGMHEIFDKNFDMVHQNNMSKAHTSEQHAIETAKQHNEYQCTITNKEDYWIVTNKYGKIIKPWDHKKVLLSLT